MIYLLKQKKTCDFPQPRSRKAEGNVIIAAGLWRITQKRWDIGDVAIVLEDYPISSQGSFMDI